MKGVAGYDFGKNRATCGPVMPVGHMLLLLTPDRGGIPSSLSLPERERKE